MSIKITVTDEKDTLFCKNLFGKDLKQITIKTDKESMTFLINQIKYEEKINNEDDELLEEG